MGRLSRTIAMIAALGIAYEMGREKGAKDMFIKFTVALLELKAKEAEKEDESED